MKRIKANFSEHLSNGIYVSYTVNGKEFFAQGEFYYDGKHYHHTHFGPRGGEYDIIFK